MAKKTTQKKAATPKAAAAVLELNALISPVVTLADGSFQATVEARVTKGVHSVPKVAVMIHDQKNIMLDFGDTDNKGLFTSTLSFPATDAGKTINLRVRLKSQNDESQINFELPEAQGSKVTNANHIQLKSYVVKSTGEAIANIYVTLEDGKVGVTPVNITYCGKEHELLTNPLGHVAFELENPVPAGEIAEIYATTPGIEKECVLKVHNAFPRKRVGFFKKIGAMLMSPIFWLMSLAGFIFVPVFFIGLYVLLFSKSFDERMSASGSNLDILWIIPVMLSIVWFILFCVYLVYSIFIKHAVIAGAQIIKEKTTNHSSSAGDSFIENTEELIDELKGLKKPNVSVTNVDAQGSKKASSKSGFFNSVWAKVIGGGLFVFEIFELVSSLFKFGTKGLAKLKK